jgi:hypothetical protein
MKRFIPTLIALLLLGGLGTWVYLRETKARTGETRQHIWQASADDVEKFELDDPGKQTKYLASRRADGTWWLADPGLEVDADAADQVRRHLADPEVERKLDPPKDLSPFGLKEPRFRATVFLKGGKKRVLLLGEKNPTGSSYFAMEEGGRELYTVVSYAAEALMKDLGSLRSKVLMSFEPAKVDRVLVRRPKLDTLEFRREGEGWRMVSPVSAAADRYAVDGLLSDVKAVRGAELVEERAAFSRNRLDQPSAVICVFTGTLSGQVLTLSRPPSPPGTACATSTRLPFVFRLGSTYVLDNALKPAAEWREKLLLQMDREALGQLKLRQGALEIDCRKGADGKWKVVKPASSGTVPAESGLDDVLFEAVYLRAERFVDDAPKSLGKLGLDKPRLGVTLVGSGKGNMPVSHEYLLGNRDGAVAMMKFRDSPAVYGVRVDLLDKLERFADRFRPSSAAPRPAAPPARKTTGKKR